MKSKANRTSDTPEAVWQVFIQEQVKLGSKLGRAYQSASFVEFNNKTLTLRVPDEASRQLAESLYGRLIVKLPPRLQPCNRVNISVGAVLQSASVSAAPSGERRSSACANPLQAMNHTEFGRGRNDEKLVQPVLVQAVEAEKGCKRIYEQLSRRTELLAGGAEHTLPISFNWRLRVGGTRGFDERLLPAFHPVFGVPYIPASTLKGAARAWARKQKATDIETILGMLDGTIAKAAKVEFLDAFPTSHCLDVDVATPQWNWGRQNSSLQVNYQPTPFPMLSLKQPTLIIGLRPTKPEYAKYVPIVRNWLENALKCGIGSRVSGGYGRALEQIATLPRSCSYGFELWTQGMYGSNPPSSQNEYKGTPEFRPTAVRGILRYWFRSIALSLYDPAACQTLEKQVFGTLGQQGKVNVSVVFNDTARSTAPFDYAGKIHLEAVDSAHLTLMRELLILASHLGGVGCGSRRPLHLLDVNGQLMMRGCNWSVDVEGFPLACDANQWRSFVQRLHAAFNAVQPSMRTYLSSPGEPKNERKQDVLDANAQIWLLRSPNLIQPENNVNWSDTNLRGAALNLMYGDDRFKGYNNKSERGNSRVGGGLGTPSFVWIKSIFPQDDTPYQAVAIFGANQFDRQAFATALRQAGALPVFNSPPNSLGNPGSSRPRRR